MPTIFGKKKEKSKNKDVASSLSDVSKTNSSLISLSITEMTYSSTPSANQVAQSRKEKEKEKADERRNDIIETALSGTTVVLGLVSQAAQFAPVPGLQNAASLAIGIVKIIQGVKDSNRQYGLLAKDATDFVASIWRSYQKSTSKEDWPSPDLRDVITELVVTLTDITEFVEEKARRRKFTKMLSSNADPAQVLEYRQRINSAIKKFEIASHLEMNELLLQVRKDQLQLAQQLDKEGIETISTAAMLLHALGKSASGYEIAASTNSSSSLVALSSSVVSSQSTSAATSPRASDQPSAFLVEESAQSPRIVLTDADTPPPADSTSSNSPQPPSPPVAFSSTFSPASQPLPPSSSPSPSPPTSLPSSPSYTGTSISAAVSASVSTEAVSSPTLVGSPESELVPALTAATHSPSSNAQSDKSNHINDHHEFGQEDQETHDICITVDATHAPLTDPGPDDVRMGKRMPSTSGNTILKGSVTASPSGTASESESRSGRSPTPSDTDTAVSEGDLLSAAGRLMNKERQFFSGGKRIDDDEEEEEQYEEQPPRSKRGGRPPRTDTDATLTSERRDTLKSPPPRREQRQTTVYEEEERYDSPGREEPRRRPRQETEEYLQPRKRPQAKLAQDAYGSEETYDRRPARPARGPVGRPGPQRGDTARYGRQRGDEAYDDEEEEEPRRVPGKGKAPQRNYQATVQDANDDDEEEEEFDQEECSEDESQDSGNAHLNKYVAGARRKAAAVVSKRTASAVAAGSSARNAAASNNAVGKDEKLSIKFSKLNINSRRQQQQEEEDEEEEEEEEDIPPPPKKRRPKRPQHEDPYNQHGHYNAYAPAPDPYYGSYPAPYPGYHHPPPPPPHPSYYAPSPPPRYGPGALGFIPGLGYGNGTSSTVTMTNVGNDNSVHIITNKTKKSKRREG